MKNQFRCWMEMNSKDELVYVTEGSVEWVSDQEREDKEVYSKIWLPQPKGGSLRKEARYTMSPDRLRVDFKLLDVVEHSEPNEPFIVEVK